MAISRRFCLMLLFQTVFANEITFNILHINDFHARFDETNLDGGECKGDLCIGGFPRLYQQIQDYYSMVPETILLNAGDNFQGTLWYNLFKWNVTQHFFNKLPWDAYVLGNHEFDDGIAGVVPHIKSLKAPTVCANIDDTFEPTMQGIYNRSVVIERFGVKIGIIGVILRKTDDISNTEKLIFLDESASVNAEAERLVREENVFTNIVLSHSGFGIDLAIAGNATAASKISVVVGGHTNTFLYTGTPVPGPLKPQGVYPTVVNRTEDQQPVLVVQASCYNRFLGNLTVTFDSDGTCKSFAGNPIYLSAELAKNTAIDQEMEPWRREVASLGGRVLGTSFVTLDRTKCKQAECLLGDFVTDAMIFEYVKRADLKHSWTTAALAVMNPGGLRTTISKGNVTYSDMTTANPFENTVDTADILGADLKRVFEFSMMPYSGRRPYDVNLLQVSGFRLTFNLSQPLGERVQELRVRCAACPVPRYEHLDPAKTYRLIVPSFLRNAGDGFQVLQNSLKNIEVGRRDIDVLVDYFESKSKVFQEVEGRFQIVGATKKGIIYRDFSPEYKDEYYDVTIT